MFGSIVHRPPVGVARATRATGALSDGTFYFMTAVVLIQGGHVIEHIVQLAQVFVFGVPETTRSDCSATCSSSTAPRRGCTSATTPSICWPCTR
jgi:hypothetical protein